MCSVTLVENFLLSYGDYKLGRLLKFFS